jgi:hypothetical protein
MTATPTALITLDELAAHVAQQVPRRPGVPGREGRGLPGASVPSQLLRRCGRAHRCRRHDPARGRRRARRGGSGGSCCPGLLPGGRSWILIFIGEALWASRAGTVSLWRRGDSNAQPPPCKGGALPIELRPRAVPRQRDESEVASRQSASSAWLRRRLRTTNAAVTAPTTSITGLFTATSLVGETWAWEDLNLRPHPYQGCALTV